MVVMEVNLTKPITPEELPEIVALATDNLPAAGSEGIVLSGRMPVWAYGALVHEYHPRPWIATYDPRIGGGVVVATHTPGVSLGQVIGIENAEKITVEF